MWNWKHPYLTLFIDRFSDITLNVAHSHCNSICFFPKVNRSKSFAKWVPTPCRTLTQLPMYPCSTTLPHNMSSQICRRLKRKPYKVSVPWRRTVQFSWRHRRPPLWRQLQMALWRQIIRVLWRQWTMCSYRDPMAQKCLLSSLNNSMLSILYKKW